MVKSQSNKELRLFYKKLRNEMSDEDRKLLSSDIVNNVLALLESDFKGANIFLCFYPYGSEVDLTDLYNRLLNIGKELYFPVSDVESHQLTFYKVSDLSNDFSKGAYGIMEPNRTLPAFDAKEDGVIAITPGLVFDRNLNRIGYGAGFYDRFFAQNSNIIRIAPCFSNQIVEKIQAESHDLPMDYIVTDNQVLRGKCYDTN